MNITLKIPENMSKKTLYMLTKSPEVTSLKNVPDDTEFVVREYIVYEDTNSKGESVEILSLLTDGGAYASQSQTFKDQFDEIVDIFGLPVTIKKLSGTTKAGREYITCDYAGE